jgi:formate/nitrite transporter FocA (FNT family)
MMLGAPISLGQWLFWNLLPVTLGNFLAGALFTGLALHATYSKASSPAVAEHSEQQGGQEATALLV